MLNTDIDKQAFRKSKHSSRGDQVGLDVTLFVGFDNGNVDVPMQRSLRKCFDGIGVEVAVDSVVAVLASRVVRNYSCVSVLG